MEDGIIRHRDRIPTITASCEPAQGEQSVIFERIRPKIEAIDLPHGYGMEWGGEFESSSDAQAALFKNIPITVVMMILITIALFNSLRQPLIIWLTVPLAVIGVSMGLLVTNQPFGFMALLGFLGLSGMLIKNAIVLIDQINIELAGGKAPYQAVVDASVSRMRPVFMAAGTTVLGMIPLLGDVFFIGMAVTIMFGLTFASLLTLFAVPVFYSLLYRVKRVEQA
jgi:multidrug efflux pump subunit AcrB